MSGLRVVFLRLLFSLLPAWDDVISSFQFLPLCPVPSELKTVT